MLKNTYIYILFIIIIEIIIIITIIYKMKSIKEYDGINRMKQYTYYRCPDKELGLIMRDIFYKYYIQRVSIGENWDIYIPCGYNNVEIELKKIVLSNDVNNNNPNKQKFIFGISGCDLIVSKNKIWESLVKCYGREEAKSLMPESYILDNEEEMNLFKNDYNPNMGNIYILKKNVQRKEGLKLTKNYSEIMNASEEQYRIVQKYITDLYFIHERKVNLRVYFLVVIKKDVRYFYVSKLGKCIYTNKKYNDNDLDFESNITSYNLDMTVYEKNPRHFSELIDFMGKNKGDKLFKNIDLLMKQVSMCIVNNVYQSYNVNNNGITSFQLFGADVIFDKNLHPYLLEMNKGPDMMARDDIDKKMKTMVQEDMLKTVGILNDDDKNNSFYLIYKK